MNAIVNSNVLSRYRGHRRVSPAVIGVPGVRGENLSCSQGYVIARLTGLSSRIAETHAAIKWETRIVRDEHGAGAPLQRQPTPLTSHIPVLAKIIIHCGKLSPPPVSAW